ncbi:acyltransferase family protein [Paucibacter sp. R3-3]|uniref:Acyltransferase family protein n=1 Tax=Roseateles agri TaxID=3098619 RepID=A0ABU5DLT6_9BURK|nr:acyltransferase family protein [Paucibacter sp. R3-3]MDY0747257.1 acyltransferase family protein [Paucibacter sp. R3-3]
MRFRPDIEGLRALAIVPVVAFHAWPWLLTGGYVGVDVFFVISGYLITMLLLQRLEAGKYSVASFYAARIRRIFPALFVMLALIVPAAWLLLAPQAMGEFARVFGATGLFASNVELYRTTGYFEGATELKPLVHTWSLAVEEQYYIVFPLLLAALYRRSQGAIGWVLAGLGLVSLAYAQYLVRSDPPLAFYSALSRTCELMVGSLLAVRVDRGRPPLSTRVRQLMGLAGLATIISACVLLKPDSAFPGLTALWPCLGAAALIEAGRGDGSGASRLLALPPLRWIGALSFSLYLWHWPMLVFSRHLLLGQPDALQAGAAVLLAVAVAWASLHWVEIPVRRAAWRQRTFLLSGGAAIAMCLVLGGGLFIAARRAGEAPTASNALLTAAADFSPGRERCHTRERVQITYLSRCQFGDANAAHQLAVWGDSHGVEIGQALSEFLPGDRSLAAMTAAACPPSLDFAMPGRSYCRPHNEAILAGLVADAKVDRVLIVARASSYLGDSVTAEAFEKGLRAAILALVAHGKEVWLMDPVPTYDYPVPAALAQYLRRGRDPADYGMTRQVYQRMEARSLDMLARASAATGARRVSVEDALCGSGHCAVVGDDGRGLYLDSNHLSMVGARLLVSRALLPAVQR